MPTGTGWRIEAALDAALWIVILADVQATLAEACVQQRTPIRDPPGREVLINATSYRSHGLLAGL